METFSALLAFCAGNSPSTGEFPHKGQWRGALMFTLICARINGWANNREAGDLRRYPPNYDVIVITWRIKSTACATTNILLLSYVTSLFSIHIPAIVYPWHEINSYLPGENGRHFTDDIFRYMKVLYFDWNFTENCSWGPIHNKPALV